MEGRLAISRHNGNCFQGLGGESGCLLQILTVAQLPSSDSDFTARLPELYAQLEVEWDTQDRFIVRTGCGSSYGQRLS
jgi:hypothetical protein